ncbi:MAG TPA: hypothetical protein VK063_00755 [Beutenbergiaceae bacterium]|nr:hypothetical protein [Beutenbergiaceae bacterium]
MSTTPLDQRTGILVDDSACDPNDLAQCGAITVAVGADEDWGQFVGRAMTSGWPGVEFLDQVPGTVADAVRHNPVVSGQSVGAAVASVRTWDRKTDSLRTFPRSDCGFEPGGSRFQELLADDRERYDILQVTFLFKQGDFTARIQDAELAEFLSVDPGERIPLTEYAERRRGERDSLRASGAD